MGGAASRVALRRSLLAALGLLALGCLSLLFLPPFPLLLPHKVLVHPTDPLSANAALGILVALANAADEILAARVVRAERETVGDGDRMLKMNVGSVVDEGACSESKGSASRVFGRSFAEKLTVGATDEVDRFDAGRVEVDTGRDVGWVQIGILGRRRGNGTRREEAPELGVSRIGRDVADPGAQKAS